MPTLAVFPGDDCAGFSSSLRPLSGTHYANNNCATARFDCGAYRCAAHCADNRTYNRPTDSSSRSPYDDGV